MIWVILTRIGRTLCSFTGTCNGSPFGKSALSADTRSNSFPITTSAIPVADGLKTVVVTNMINKEKVEQLIEQIRYCDVYEVVGESPFLNDVTWDTEVIGKPDNQVLLIKWHAVWGQEFSVILTEQGLSDAVIDENKIICKDHEGDEITIALYSTNPLHIFLDIDNETKKH